MSRTVLAAYNSVCQLCDEPILRGQAIVPRHGGYIHRHCAPGADDE